MNFDSSDIRPKDIYYLSVVFLTNKMNSSVGLGDVTKHNTSNAVSTNKQRLNEYLSLYFIMYSYTVDEAASPSMGG